MSSNDDGDADMLGLVILILGVVFFSAIVALVASILTAFGAFLAFVAFAWTLVCLLAWNRPFHLGRIYLASNDARAFVLRGLFGAITVPVFLVLVDTFTEIPVNWKYSFYFATGGYVLLSVGFEYVFATETKLPYVHHDLNPVQFQLSQRETLYLPPPEQKPFQFARWDDDEELP